MTTLALPLQRDANLPSFGQEQFVVLGDAMGSVVRCVLEVRSELVSAMRCNFWRQVVTAEYPELAVDTPSFRLGSLTSGDLELASQYADAAARLVPTKFPTLED